MGSDGAQRWSATERWPSGDGLFGGADIRTGQTLLDTFASLQTGLHATEQAGGGTSSPLDR